MSPLKYKDMQEHRASPAKTVGLSDKRGWIDPIDTVEARETASVWLSWRECVCVFVPARLGGPPGQLCEPVHTCPRVCLVLMCVLWFEAC